MAGLVSSSKTLIRKPRIASREFTPVACGSADQIADGSARRSEDVCFDISQEQWMGGDPGAGSRHRVHSCVRLKRQLLRSENFVVDDEVNGVVETGEANVISKIRPVHEALPVPFETS